MASETLDTPTNVSTSNGTGETNPPEDCANVSHSSPDKTQTVSIMATETLDPPTNGSIPNGTGETNPPEDHANVSHSSPDANPNAAGDGEQGEKRKRTDVKTTSVHPLWKTSLCSYFRRTGGACSHGETCRYAHGEDELRPRPDNTWDPTSERAKKLKLENDDRDKEEEEKDEEVMMTETISEDGCSESSLDKCLVNLPMKWTSDQLRNFLNEQGVQFQSAKTRKGMVVGFVTFETTEQVKIAIEKLQGKTCGNKTLKIADVIPRSFDKIVKPKMGSDNILESGNEGEDGDSLNESSTPGGSVLKGKSAREVVTPLAHMSYTEQLDHKKNALAQTMKKLTKNARKACPNGVTLPDWILSAREIGGLPCKLEGIIESPIVNGYRNKCEFSVGYSLQGKPTVGFSLGNFREGVTAVEEPLDCPNVSEISCKYAQLFQNFLQNSSFPLWNRMNNSGFWRQLTVREGRTPGKIADEVESGDSNVSEVLLMVQISSKGFDDEDVNVELEKMAEAFVVGASTNSPSLPLTVLVVQDHQGISNVAPADAPLRHLSLTKGESRLVEDSEVVAEARIQDYVNNLRFFISPTAFFQVNTLAAEKLYSLAGDWAGLGPNTLLFDVCCGTGTIGLTLAHRVGMVVGIEMNASAVADANRNAEINGIKNCRFVCSKAENVMGSLLKEYLTNKVDDQRDSGIADSAVGITEETNSGIADSAVGNNEETNESEEKSLVDAEDSKMHHFENVVAIVDPPRVGLHPTVIKALRTHSRLRRLVYISCNPESLVANAIELCTPSADSNEKGNNKNNGGWRRMSSAGLARHRAKSMPTSEPFKPVKAMAVDLFPHTPHCELVMLLER